MDAYWNNRFLAVYNDPAYVAAREKGNEQEVLEVALSLIGETKESYDAYKAEAKERENELNQLASRWDELNLKVAIYNPMENKEFVLKELQ